MVPEFDLLCKQEVVGYLQIDDYDHYWNMARFQPGPGFELIRTLFDRMTRLRSDLEKEHRTSERHRSFREEFDRTMNELNRLELTARDRRSGEVRSICDIQINEPDRVEFKWA